MKQRGGELYVGSKPTTLGGKKLYVDEDKLDAKFQANYVSARRFFTVGELKEQLLVSTGVKTTDQIVTYRDHVLEVTHPRDSTLSCIPRMTWFSV